MSWYDVWLVRPDELAFANIHAELVGSAEPCPHWLDAWACFAVLQDVETILWMANREMYRRQQREEWL